MKKVFLASQSKSFLDRNTTFLVRRGFRLFSATSGAETLKYHEKHHLDLILADYKLDDMFGHVLCSQVKSAGQLRQIPIIVASQNVTEQVELAKASGASKVLLKPVDPKTLLTTITHAIDMQVIRNRRVALGVAVLCKKHDQEFFSHAHDISNTGILVESDNLTVGNRVICQFALPNSGHVEAEGEVVRATLSGEGKPLCGINFVNIHMSCLRTIVSYVVSTATAMPNAIIPHYPHHHSSYA